MAKQNPIVLAAAAGLLGLGSWSGVFAVEPRLDGLLGEWQPADLIATDPAGDASGAFDVRNVYATNRGTRLFLRFDIGAVKNLQSGDSGDGTLRVQINMPNNRALTIDTRARTLYRDNNAGLTVTWSSVGYSTAPSHAANEFELSADLAQFGVVVGSPISINFTGSDSLSASAPYTMTQPAVTPLRRSAAAAPGTQLRIASVNTEQTGLLDGTQQPRLLRLVDAMNADIYCFQEEYSSTAAQIDGLIQATDPTEDGAGWTVQKNNDCVIASRFPMIALSPVNSSYMASIVVMDATHSVVVFSIHPKCCGYIGNADDAQRISQMNGLVGQLNNLRSGALGPAYEPYREAPAIIVGDWNLVGSRTPLDMVVSPSSPELTDAFLPQLIGEDVTTWRGSSTGAGSFSPGRLDILCFGAEAGLLLQGGFVLDTGTLNAAELSALGLQAADSTGSDHNMLVGDFAFQAAPPLPCAGDADGDHDVDFADITSVLANFGSAGPTGDANHDLVVNFADITAVLANFGVPCP